MYKDKLAIAVKSNGKVLREVATTGKEKDTVYVPFGTEYTILIKNLRSVRALARVSIDGIDVTEGVNLVIPANSEFELERFIKNGNTNSGNRFKFIERTAKIEQHRGIGIVDGTVRVEFQFEKQPAVLDSIKEVHHYHHDHYYWRPWYWSSTQDCYGGKSYLTGSTVSGNLVSGSSSDTYSSLASDNTAGIRNVMNSVQASAASIQCSTAQNAASSKLLRSAPVDGQLAQVTQLSAQATQLNDSGITVAGSVSTQQFKTATTFEVETEVHEMVLRMLGETPQGKQVVVPVTVKSKPKCQTCGKQNKAAAKFCIECGTSLEIV